MPNDSNAPTLPPIPTSPLQDTPPSPSATPSQAAASSLGNSIDTDMPISGIVAALKNTPQTETPTAPTPAPIAPSVAPSIPSPVQEITTPTGPNDKAASSPPPLPKSPLYEDPDQIKVSGVS